MKLYFYTFLIAIFSQNVYSGYSIQPSSEESVGSLIKDRMCARAYGKQLLAVDDSKRAPIINEMLKNRDPLVMIEVVRGSLNPNGKDYQEMKVWAGVVRSVVDAQRSMQNKKS